MHVGVSGVKSPRCFSSGFLLWGLCHPHGGTRMDSQAPNFGLAQHQLLQVFREVNQRMRDISFSDFQIKIETLKMEIN